MKRKGFTLVELLVVIAIIALLMSILMPVLSMVRKLAQQAVCGANLGGLHKAVLSYAEENNGDYPRAGGRNSTWGETALWDARPTSTEWGERGAFGETLVSSRTDVSPPVYIYGNGKATIGASFYLLVRDGVGTKAFVCKGDKGARIFSFTEQSPRTVAASAVNEVRKAWDFGSISTDATLRKKGLNVAQYYSYAYHIPYLTGAAGYFQLSMGSRSNIPIMADRSPYLVITPDSARPAYEYTAGLNEQKEKWGNSTNHDNDGQNVLFNDGGVSFNKVPYCGNNNDNIYTMADTSKSPHIQAGWLPNLGGGGASPMYNPGVKPITSEDSVLVNEGGEQGSVVAN